MKKIFVAAGETSGDLHGYHLAQSLLKADPSLVLYGSGGPMMQQIIPPANFFQTAHLNVTGFTEVLKHIPHYLRLMDQMKAFIRKAEPDAVILIDNPGFNLRMLPGIASGKTAVIYYICPQVWAWNPGRVETMKKFLKKALVVFKFEEDFLKKRGMADAVWVGHPLKDFLPEPLAEKNSKPPARVLLMPGSRMNEVAVLLPILVKAAELIHARLPHLEFGVVQADGMPARVYDDALSRSSLSIGRVTQDRYEAMRRADLTLICSGTATLEAALLGLPMIIVYKASFITHMIAKALVKVPFIGLPNLLAGEKIAPELLQNNCTPQKIAAAAELILTDDGLRRGMRGRLADAVKNVGARGASDRAAKEILDAVR